ncbi:MAG: glycosyltransferase [Burkholderiales bacterium]
MKILFVTGRYAYGDPVRGEGYEHSNMLPALATLGHDVVLFESFDRSAYSDFGALNAAFIETLHRENPDVVLLVLQAYELWSETLDLARATHRAALVNWGTDDSWKYSQFARPLAPHLDCWATTSSAAFDAAVGDGLTNFVLTQWAATDTFLATPRPAAECRYPVSFVGAAYGNRRRWIEGLAARGIAVVCFGAGWANGPIAASEVTRVFRDSAVSLNFADSGLHLRGLMPYRDRQLKARVFEVPGAGGLLLTQVAPGLDRYYRAGEEVLSFDSLDDAARQIKRVLDDPAERDRIAQAGHRRTRAEHTSGRRLEALLEAAIALRERGRGGVVNSGTDTPANARLAALRAAHLPGVGLKVLRAVLSAPFGLAWGKRRGARAARRVLYELSWRIAPRHTYSANGWPGRLFYRQS